MFIRQCNARVDQRAGCELWSRLLRRAFEGELWEGGIGCVVAQTSVVQVDSGSLDRGYDEIADCGDVLIC